MIWPFDQLLLLKKGHERYFVTISFAAWLTFDHLSCNFDHQHIPALASPPTMYMTYMTAWEYLVSDPGWKPKMQLLFSYVVHFAVSVMRCNHTGCISDEK